MIESRAFAEGLAMSGAGDLELLAQLVEAIHVKPPG